MKHSRFDRAAIAFGAFVIGSGAALVLAGPILLMLISFAAESDSIDSSLFWKVPLLIGVLFGAAGFMSPNFVADWLGRTWKGAAYVWRMLTGA